ncbi:hypothetical protein [Spirosoma spitsbergense]|jgi:hypothetical protein|uniref:hypothetical protein n=1 Tax=Spirosoma spitsbergense TaxID=431554 RepID=UPI00039E41BA|nr:hypothetical protein [Spirosoma spitsbergense]
MKNQFSIKPAESLKKIKSSVAKKESNSILKFSLLSECCAMGPDLNRFSTPVFSL